MNNSIQLNTNCSCPLEKYHHTFSFKPLKTGLYHRDELQITFCPQYCKKTSVYQNTYPQAFFDDKVHFPLFMLEVDRQPTIKREKQYIEAHYNKIKVLEYENQQILVPHPGKSKSTCFVCKSQYSDYRRHIQTKVHKKKLNSSKMQSSISQLVHLVSNSSEKIKDEIAISSGPSLIRLSSMRTDTSSVSNSGRLSKKQMKQIKLKEKMSQIEDISFNEVEDSQKYVEIQLQGFSKKPQDYKTTTIQNISMHQFRVSDYLI